MLYSRQIPQAFIELNTSNYYARNLAFLHYSGLSKDAGPFNHNLTNNTVTATLDPTGIGIFGSDLAYSNLGLINTLRSSIADGSGDFALFCYGSPQKVATIYRPIAFDQLSSPAYYTYLGFNEDSNAGVVAGRVAFVINSGDSVESFATQPSAIDGLPHFWIATRLNQQLKIYKDGVQTGATFNAGESLPLYDGINPQYASIQGPPNGIGRTYLAGALNVGLSTTEARDLSENPHQLWNIRPALGGIHMAYFPADHLYWKLREEHLKKKSIPQPKIFDDEQE